MDPWHYLEITPTKGIKPCCKIPAIVNWVPDGPSFDQLRSAREFELLRAQLLTGEMGAACRDCHIRPLVPLHTLRSAVQGAARTVGAADWLQPLPLQRLRIEITTRCNLRCVYCAVSQSDYRARDMPSLSFDEIIELVGRQPPETDIFVNGHGETTFHPDWLYLCRAIVDRGFRPCITSNLAKPLNADETACLSEFREVQVSIDTVAAEQLRNIRRRVKLSTIIDNIRAIRSAADTRNHPSPVFTVSCGVYDLNYRLLGDLAQFCISMGITGVTFWQLVKYDDLPGVRNVYPITSLGKESIDDAIRHVESAITMLEQAGLVAVVAGGFLDEWRKLI
jgi:hypothetical protein